MTENDLDKTIEDIRFDNIHKQVLLELELTKYKRAFEILKEYNNVKFDLIDKKIIYYLDQENQAHVISKEEYELLEELMDNENTK